MRKFTFTLLAGLGTLLMGLPTKAQPVITAQPTNQILAEGGLLALNVSASGSTPISYQWFKGGKSLAGG